MSRISRWGGIAIVLAFVVEPSRSADVVKLRPAAAIYVDGKGAGLRQPEGVACGPGAILVVADTGNGRLVRYSRASDRVSATGEIVLPQLPSPIRTQVDSKGEILALDGKLRRIARLSAAGEFKGYLDLGAGGVDGAVVPRSFRIDRTDRMWVLDVLSARILVFGSEGKLQRKIAFPEAYGFFSDLAVDGRGTVFALDSVGRRIYSAGKDATALSPLGESLKDDLDFPTGIAVDDTGRLYVADQNGGGIVIVGPDGSFRGRQSSMGWREGFLRYPSGLCHDGNGRLFIADRGNNRVQEFLVAQ